MVDDSVPIYILDKVALAEHWILTAVVFIAAIRAVPEAITLEAANNAVDPVCTSKECGSTL